MKQTKEQLLKELGFSDVLIERMNERNHLFNFVSKERVNFNCVTVENDDITEMIIENIDQPYVSSIFYSE